MQDYTKYGYDIEIGPVSVTMALNFRAKGSKLMEYTSDSCHIHAFYVRHITDFISGKSVMSYIYVLQLLPRHLQAFPHHPYVCLYHLLRLQPVLRSPSAREILLSSFSCLFSYSFYNILPPHYYHIHFPTFHLPILYFPVHSILTWSI